MASIIIGVMGGGEASKEDCILAEQFGRLIAKEGFVTLSGGRNTGVMEAVSRGAKAVGGLVIGILPTRDQSGVSPHVDIPICTGMGSARNVINILSSDVVIACGIGKSGTASEIAHALKVGKPVILLCPSKEAETFFRSMEENLLVATSPQEAMALTKKILSS